MKDQYFGDVNDYLKYALLIHLSGRGGLSTGICWMLTHPDGRTDGSACGYLNKSRDFRHFAPDLFDLLYTAVVVEKDRRVARFASTALLRNAVYHSSYLPDDKEGRDAYFRECLTALKDVDWVFVDPDNGVEVPSTASGRKGSSKFIYWHEVAAFYQTGKSVLIYQHFPRKSARALSQSACSFTERSNRGPENNYVHNRSSRLCGCSTTAA